MTPIETIKRVAGLDPKRETCMNKCQEHKARRSCDCYPGISLDDAVRLFRRVEAYFQKEKA